MSASTCSGVLLACDREDFDQIGDAGLLGRAFDLAAGVGDRALELLENRGRLVEHVHGALLGATGGGHLARGVLQVHDARADLGDAVLGHHQHVLASAKAGVEAPRHVAHQLQVLALVLANGHLVGAVGEHVGGLQHRVDEQAGRHQLALLDRLVAELVHALQASQLGHRAQQPAQLAVLGHVALAKQDAARRVETCGEQQCGEVIQAAAQLRGLIGDGDRVQVDDAIQRLAAILTGDVLADRADVVAQVLGARGLDAGEDAHGEPGYREAGRSGNGASASVKALGG